MKTMEVTFLIMIFLFVQYTTKTSTENTIAKKKLRQDAKVLKELQRTIPEDEYVHLIVDIHQEDTDGDNLYTDEKHKDILGIEFKDPFVGISDSVAANIEKKAETIRKFLQVNELWSKGWDNPRAYSFATADRHSNNKVDFYTHLLRALFPATYLFNMKQVTLTHGNRNKLTTYEGGDDSMVDKLILLCYGYYRKAHGLNLNLEICPEMRKTFESLVVNENEYKLFLALTKSGDLINEIAARLKDTKFLGKNKNGEMFFYNGVQEGLKSKADDLMNFLDTVEFDINQLQKQKLITQEEAVKLLKLRNAFYTMYTKQTREYTAQKFISFTKQLMNERDYFMNNPISLLPKDKLKLKKWISIGTTDLPLIHIADYLTNAKIDNPLIYDEFEFVFVGDINKIKKVKIYYDFQFVGDIPLDEYFKMGVKDESNAAFNKLCIGKEESTQEDEF